MKSWLACNNQRWLLIIDNADDPDIDYSEYIPSSKRGDILLTTRNPECVVYNSVGSEILGDLEPKLAQKLLLRATYLPESRWMEKEKAAMAVVEILGSHTLAIIQAGAFVRQKLCTLEEYPTLFQQQKGQLLKFQSKQNVSAYGNVYATFEVSAEHLQKSKLQENTDALNLIHTLAFLHNRRISETMFQKASEYASELRDTGTSDDESVLSLSISHVARLPDYAKQTWSSLQNRLRWRKALSVLESLSIITVCEDDDSTAISLHSLVHVWAKERQGYQSRCRAWQSAATIVALSCQGQYAYCPFFVLIRPHVRACVNHEINDYTKHMTDVEAAQILFQFAYTLYFMKDRLSFRVLVQRIRQRLEARSGANQKILLQIIFFTGFVYLDQGENGKAVEIFKEVVDVQSRAMTEDHPDRMASQHLLAISYAFNKQNDEATALFEHAVRIRERLPEDNMDRLHSHQVLAVAYRVNGRISKAVAMLEHIVKIKEMLAEDNFSRLASQHELATTYQANGQISKAVLLLEHNVKIREMLTENNFSRLASQQTLANAYKANGQIDKCISLLEHVVKIKEKLSENHLSRLTSQYALANAYEANGQIKKCIPLLEHVVKINEENSIKNPFRYLSQQALAYAYKQNGQIEKCIALLEHVVKIDEKMIIKGPSRFDSRHELAVAYGANNQYEKGILVLKQMVKTHQKLPKDHPDRIASQDVLALFERAIKSGL